MIAVIADDLSGAAELAGAAAKLGLRAEVHTVFDPHTDAEVVAVDTDTRSAPAADAACIVADVARAVLAAKPDWVFKKTDSVLRGNVRSEIEAVRDITHQRRSLLIPANPSRNRIIRGGIYYVDGVPLAETAFASDPEHPRRSSRVAELLALSASNDKLIVPPEVTCAQDMADHAAKVDKTTLPAGGVDFFEAILRAKGAARVAKRQRPPANASSPHTLFVCGSAAAWDAGREAECVANGIPVVPMPAGIFDGDPHPAAMADWSSSVAAALRDRGRAMLAIARPSSTKSAIAPEQLAARLIEAVAAVLAAKPVGQICIEGGATAAALLRRFGWTRLTAIPIEWTGVGGLRCGNGPLLLIKPGSYPWPGAIVS